MKIRDLVSLLEYPRQFLPSVPTDLKALYWAVLVCGLWLGLRAHSFARLRTGASRWIWASLLSSVLPFAMFDYYFMFDYTGERVVVPFPLFHGGRMAAYHFDGGGLYKETAGKSLEAMAYSQEAIGTWTTVGVHVTLALFATAAMAFIVIDITERGFARYRRLAPHSSDGAVQKGRSKGRLKNRRTLQ